MSTTLAGVVMAGDLGIAESDLDAAQIELLRASLTREAKAWDDNPPERVCCLRREGGYVWVPRYFDTSLWSKVEEWGWTAGEPYTFQFKGALDPDRDQPQAVAAMVEHLNTYQGGILVAPTGVGKTVCACAVAAAMGRKVGIPVYVGHMTDNWTEHAIKLLGLSPDDIGIVQGDRCDIGKPITILSVQTLLSRGVPDVLKQQIGLLIGDECVTGDALVETDVGRVPISEIPSSGASSVLCYDEQREVWTWREIRRWLPRGRRHILTIRTMEGATLRCTPEHKLLTDRGWLQARALRPDDRVLSPAPAGAACFCPRLTVEADHGDSSGAMGRVTGPIGRSEPTNLTQLRLCADVDAVSECVSGRISRTPGSRPTSGPGSSSVTAALGRLVARSQILRSVCSTAPFLVTHRSLPERVDATPELYSIMDQSSGRGPSSKHVGWMVLPFRCGRCATTALAKQFSTAVASAIRLSAMCLRRLGIPVECLASGLSESPMRGGPGGTWTTAVASAAGSPSIPRASPKRSVTSSPSISMRDSVFCQIYKGLADTGSCGSGLKPPSDGFDASVNSRHRGWNTSFLTITSVTGDQQAGVFDLDVDEHHNFVANGFLVHNCHRYGAKIWREIVAMFPARYRLGLSANPVREDGLDDVVAWSFGAIGYRAQRKRSESVKPPSCVMLHFHRQYDYRSYCKWKKTIDGWQPGDPNPSKYDDVLASDQTRTSMFAIEIAKAARAGRCVLVMSRLVAHLERLRVQTVKLLQGMHPVERIRTNTPFPADHPAIEVGVLAAGSSKEERGRVAAGNVIFATYQMARDALNIPRLDTLFLATPPGSKKVLQPIGRLREKVEGIDRKPLMVVDCYEDADFASGRANRRRDAYRQLGMAVTEVQRVIVG